MSKYEPVIGLEVHVQLSTRTKIFCGCPTSFGAEPNSNVCPVCLGLPGALPVLNRSAVELGVQAALALNCKVNSESIFARKNYFYPDLPKGYQISQYDRPLAEHGFVDVHLNDDPNVHADNGVNNSSNDRHGATKRIGITRIHLEDDAGKSIHDGFPDSDRYTYVDLNRSGTPLIEIVTEPDIRSSDEAYEFLTALKQTLQFLDVSSCDMEKGHLRCDANVSVRLRGTEKFGTKAEVKNLNSFRFLKQALDYEIERQVALLESGGRVTQESRLYNPDLGETASMRSKEHAHDYRYFPEPDLPPLRIGKEVLATIAGNMPELPAARRKRFIGVYGLREYDADVLTSTRAIGDYFERVIAAMGSGDSDARSAANWVMGDLAAALKQAGKEIGESPVSAENLGALVGMIATKKTSGKLAKEIFPKMIETGEAPQTIIEREGLAQISDEGALGQIVGEVIASNPKQVEQYRGGKTAVLGFLVGQVMKASRGQAGPEAVNRLLKEKL
jgi:aspartyl-tRNA(Asn)/glutamyl-tRNA(Gln) amidotransferase subunit B